MTCDMVARGDRMPGASVVHNALNLNLLCLFVHGHVNARAGLDGSREALALAGRRLEFRREQQRLEVFLAESEATAEREGRRRQLAMRHESIPHAFFQPMLAQACEDMQSLLGGDAARREPSLVEEQA